MTENTYTIRLARREELPLLNEIECAAASLFREVGFDFAAEMGPLSLELLQSLQSKDQDIPWNAPFYGRLGFRALEEEELGPGLLAVREHEARDGLAVRERVCMRRELRASIAPTPDF